MRQLNLKWNVSMWMGNTVQALSSEATKKMDADLEYYFARIARDAKEEREKLARESPQVFDQELLKNQNH